MIWRFYRPLIAIAVGLLAIAAFAQPDANMLTNPGFEQLTGEGAPVNWAPGTFGTGGVPFAAMDGGHSGDNYAILKSSKSDRTDRSAWQQRILWDDTNTKITFIGWYRTNNIAAGETPSSSVRVLFNDDPEVWHHLDIQTVFFPPVDEWTEVKTTLSVPKGTRQVVIELFNWFTPGETHWDDVYARPATAEEEMQFMLPPEQAIDRDPVFGQNLPYSPADGETTTLNPPPFRWLPSGQNAKYALQIDTTPDFNSPEAINFGGMEWCAQMLREQLKPGTWYWRYGVEMGDFPTQWSMTRRFTVPEDADAWSYPEPEDFSIPAQRPHLLITADKLPEYRRRCLEGDMKNMADNLVRGVKNHAGEELVPEPDFLPKSGYERTKAYSLVFRTTRPPMDWMERAALAYVLTGDEECGAEAKRRVLHFFSWDPRGSTQYDHNDEPAMWIMMRGVRAYDWSYDLYTDEERAMIEDAMRKRAEDMYAMLRRMPFDNNPYSSHPGRTIGFLGEAGIEFYNEWPEARKYLDYITTIYWGVYPAWGKDDGGWNEGPGYWGAYMTFAMHFVVALREATGIDLAQRPFFRNTPYYRFYITPPHSRMAPFGDGTQWAPAPAGTLMYWFSSLTQDPALRWYAEASNSGPDDSILGFVLKDDDLEAKPPTELPLARYFPGVGLVSLHTSLASGADDVHFAFRSSPYGAVSHGHNDQNCFALEAYGDALAILSGYYDVYGSPHHDQWTRQTKAKNGITYDGGIGQDRGWQAKGKITAFSHGDAFDLVVGDATEAYGGRLSRAIRSVVFVRPDVFVIYDDLASEEPRNWEFQLHAIDEMNVDSATKTVITRREKATLTTRFMVPDDLNFSQTDQYEPWPDYPPDREWQPNWHLTASYTAPSTEGEFLTVLMPSRTGQEADVPEISALESDTARGVVLTYADGARDVVGFARPGVTGGISLGDFTTDAPVFAVAYGPGGEMEASLIHNGTNLSDGQKSVTQ